MTVRRSFLSILASLLLLVVPLVAHAETKILTAEATYIMGDGETPSFAEAMVLQKAKQVALEQAGTYVESYTKVQNLDLTTEEIQTIAGGILQVEVLDKKRSLVGDGLHLYVKIQATVTTDKMEELAQRIKGKNVAEEYKKLKQDYASLTEEIESIKQLLGKSTPGPERDAALARIQAKEQSFAELQRKEAAFFQRVVSGSSLVQSAKDEKARFDDIAQTISRQKIEIGEITSNPVLGDSSYVQVNVPLTISLTESEVDRLRTNVKALDGTAMGIAFVPELDETKALTVLSFVSNREELLHSFVRAVRFFFKGEGRDDYFREQIRKAALHVSFLGKDQMVLGACVIPASAVGVILNVPLLMENQSLPSKRKVDASAWGYKSFEQYMDQSQEWRAWVKSEAAFGPLPEKYKKDFTGNKAGTGPLSSIKGVLPAWFHMADLQKKIDTLPEGHERKALEERLQKLGARHKLLDKLSEAYEKDFGGEIYLLYGEKSRSRYEELVEKSILGDEKAKEAKYDEFSGLPSLDAVIVMRDTGKAWLSVKVPVELIRGLSQVTARFELGGAWQVDGLQALYKGYTPRQQELLDEVIRRWSRVTSEYRTKLSKEFREKGMIPLDASVSSSKDVPMIADRHRGIFCSARSVAAE